MVLALASFAGGGSAAQAEAVPLVRNGTAVAKIYVSPEELHAPKEWSTENDTTKNRIALAVEDLQYHLETMSGARIEVVEERDLANIPAPAIVVGSLAAGLGCTVPASKWREGYRVLSKDGRVLIQGESLNGTSHGIYALLRELGCDWVMPGKGGEVIPASPTIGLPEVDESGAPDFGMRWMWYRGGEEWATKTERQEFDLWKRRQRLGTPLELKETGQGHFWDQLIARHPQIFKDDPDMLALVRRPDGTMARQGPQLETTNPKVVELFVDEIRRTFAREGWPSDKAVTLPIGPADGDGFSESAESLIAGSGKRDVLIGGADASDLVVKLANDVLRKAEAEFPNLSLGYYVYSVHSEYPRNVTPHPKIYPIFAPISYSRLHGIRDPHSKTRHLYGTILEEWVGLARSQGNRLMVYEYNWNLADNMLPFTRLKMIGEDLPLYHELGFEGVTIEATKAWAVNGAHDYLAARLMWDASLNWKQVLEEYCQHAFGAAAPMLNSYYLRLADVQSLSGREAGSYFSAPLIFDRAYMDAAGKDVKAALAQTLTEDQRKRVEGAVFPFQTLKNYLKWDAAMKEFDFSKARAVYDEMMSGWENMLAQNPHWVAREVPIYMKGLMEGSMTEALKYSSKPYTLVYRFPDKLATALDPLDQGERLNLQGTVINDSGWTKTSTYGSTWDAQGLSLFREGSVWYRVKFALPDRDEGEGAGLLLGGFEDEARVWINGSFAGSSGVKFANPHVFDLTDQARFGGENILAIQVRRNSKINEIGLGGIIRPSFIFVGPRLASQPSSEDEKYRILPGGERERINHSAQ